MPTVAPAFPSAAYWNIWLRLGRVSNLPTVWSNTVTGALLGWIGLHNGAQVATQSYPGVAQLVFLMLAFSLIYTGGMFLNDAFDAAIDARERPDRPIPAGLVSRKQVFLSGFVLLLLGVLTVALVAMSSTDNFAATDRHPVRSPIAAIVAASALVAMVVLYDMWHKNNPLSPLLMGLCRVLVYVTAAFAVTGFNLSTPLLSGVVALLAYLVGLTAIAKQENLQSVSSFWPLALLFMPPVIAVWLTAELSVLLISLVVLFALWTGYVVRVLVENKPGAIPRCVGMMIAAISLVDMLMVAAVAVIVGRNAETVLSDDAGLTFWVWMVFCLLCFGVTRVLQRFVPGT